MSQSDHFVQFYEADEFLLNSLRGFIGAGLSDNDGCIVIATKAHREKLEALLIEDGLDLAGARVSGQYISLDAAETLAKFAVDGKPEPNWFAEIIGGVLTKMADRPRIRAFGEMVALLWAEGRQESAIQLEELWNNLQKRYSFSLFCAYPMTGFNKSEFAEPLSHVCTTHSHVIPAESYTDLSSLDDRLRAIIKLQQKAKSLEAEIAERMEAEKRVHTIKDELELQVEDLRRLHEISLTLTSTLDIEAVLRSVLEAALDIQGTRMGLLSLIDAEHSYLRVKVSQGFNREFLDSIAIVPIGEAACGVCMARRQRVVVEDTETDPIFLSYRDAAQKAGFRACHSTPLITSSGNMIGVLSVHFPNPRSISQRETRLMDLYARMAADFIDNARLHHRLQEELKEREQLLSREQIARVEAENANRLKDDFLATVSHELRTPLNAILGWVNLIRRGKMDPESIHRALAVVERNARGQSQIINDILDVSRIITGKLQLDLRSIPLIPVIEAAVETVRPGAEAKGVKMQMLFDPSAGFVLADADRMQQVIWNLLTNAIKFTPKGGRVQVQLERTASDVEIIVEDTGSGIESEFLPYVFDRFRQADSSITRKVGGLGLGLAIVRHLVEIQGGAVSVKSGGADRGATFTVRLPVAPVNETSGVSASYTRPGKSQTSPSFAPTAHQVDLTGLEVLVIDDELDTRALLDILLEQYGAAVKTAASSQEALEMLKQWRPDIIVSDIGMPGEDGYMFIRQVRALPVESGGGIPAIALTAYARAEDRLRVLSSGYQTHLPKPTEPVELAATIASLTGRAGRG